MRARVRRIPSPERNPAHTPTRHSDSYASPRSHSVSDGLALAHSHTGDWRAIFLRHTHHHVTALAPILAIGISPSPYLVASLAPAWVEMIRCIA